MLKEMNILMYVGCMLFSLGLMVNCVYEREIIVSIFVFIISLVGFFSNLFND